ncbi:MAG TPA: phosphoribosylaminoimidazolesuccinocarboxamide synthase [Candidatus Limnocylindrales bacterium]|jgi:phosphoribosylaminoimidazole-succinocarboxamide synthase|nr:phosphoribosylaminoimidazolesuccinocarboxamide synthase [Candidatus Limnocylindrales bacterium]
MPLAELVPGYVRSGKVRDIYALDEQRLLLVASDRISAFDVVLPTPIPDKGRVLTGLARYWFAQTAAAGLMDNHLLATAVAALPAGYADEAAADELRGRMMVCRRAEVLPVELIVRGYLAGSGWKDYRRSGAVCGIPLPDGLRESDRLPEPLFTPSTKAETGHDENISFDQMVALVGAELAERCRDLALALYRFAAERAEPAGIILADTKFEFGLLPDGRLILIDEVLTPDSSRFWDGSDYEPGRAQASYDKQFVRDWLEAQPWDKTPPGPELPPDVVAGTRARYVEAFERITGGSFDDYLAHDRVAGE